MFVRGEGKGRRFASVCMHTVGECFQSLRGIFHGHTRWAFEYLLVTSSASVVPG